MSGTARADAAVMLSPESAGGGVPETGRMSFRLYTAWTRERWRWPRMSRARSLLCQIIVIDQPSIELREQMIRWAFRLGFAAVGTLALYLLARG